MKNKICEFGNLHIENYEKDEKFSSYFVGL